MHGQTVLGRFVYEVKDDVIVWLFTLVYFVAVIGFVALLDTMGVT